MRERKLVQWSLAYLATAWVIVQLVSVLAAQFGLSLGFQRGVTVLLAVGLIAAIVIAWYHGEKGRQRVAALELLLLACVVLLAGGAVAVATRTAPAIAPAGAWIPAGIPERSSVAVLPFENLTGDSSIEYLSDGFTEELINRLANLPALRVASRTASFAYKGERGDPSAIGRQLRVAAILEGSIRRSGTTMRVTAQLIEVATGYHIWSQTFERESDDLFALEDEIASAIAAELDVALVARERTRATPANAEAYDAYLRGMYHFRIEGMSKDSAIHYLERATALDGEFAPAHALLAASYNARNFMNGGYAQAAFMEIEKALALDPGLAEAYVARGHLAWTLANGFPHEAAARDYHRALELNPNLAAAHEALGSVYSHVGLNERALAEFRRALELDPHSTFAPFRVARLLIFQGRYLEALHEIDRRPGADADWHRPLALWYLGRRDEALASLDVLRASEAPREDVASVHALVHAGLGRHEEAERWIAEAIEQDNGGSHFHHAAYNIASAYALMDRPNDAIEWLRRAALEGFPNYELFARDPNLDRIRSVPAFRSFMQEQRRLWEHHASTL